MTHRPLMTQIGAETGDLIHSAAAWLLSHPRRASVDQRFALPKGNMPAKSPSHLRLQGASLTIALSRFVGAPWGADGDPIPDAVDLARMVLALLDLRQNRSATTMALVSRNAVGLAHDVACLLDLVDPVWRSNAARMAREADLDEIHWGIAVGYADDQLLPSLALTTLNDSETVDLDPSHLLALAMRWPVVLTDRATKDGGYLIEPVVFDGTRLVDLHDHPEDPIDAIARLREVSAFASPAGTP